MLAIFICKKEKRGNCVDFRDKQAKTELQNPIGILNLWKDIGQSVARHPIFENKRDKNSNVGFSFLSLSALSVLIMKMYSNDKI
jgi:hypothetical protein